MIVVYVVAGLFVAYSLFLMGRSYQTIRESKKHVEQLELELAYEQGKLDALREISQTIGCLDKKSND
jgi:hypothetical protein